MCVSKEGQEVTGGCFGIKLLPWRAWLGEGREARTRASDFVIKGPL